MLRDVRSNQSLLPYLVSGKVAGEAVEIDTQHGGLLGRIALRQEGEDDACQHIAATRCGHIRIASSVEENGAVGHRNGGVRAFHNNNEVVLHGQFALFFKPFKRGRGLPNYSLYKSATGYWGQHPPRKARVTCRCHLHGTTHNETSHS